MTEVQLDYRKLGDQTGASSVIRYDICDLSRDASLEELRPCIAHLRKSLVFVRFVSGEAARGSLHDMPVVESNRLLLNL